MLIASLITLDEKLHIAQHHLLPRQVIVSDDH